MSSPVARKTRQWLRNVKGQNIPTWTNGGSAYVTGFPTFTSKPTSSLRSLQHAHVRDDQTQQRVLHCLQKVADIKKEAVVVISQLQFGDFLREPCYTAAASMLPRPIDLKTREKKDKHRGDFDLLFIHQEHGLVVAEMKTVGDNFADHCPDHRAQDELVAKKVEQAVKQLDKAGEVLRHLVSDLQPQPRVLKTLILPNISRNQLQRVLQNYPHIRLELCQCLGLKDSDDPVELCPCQEHFSDRSSPDDVTDDVINNLSEWWSRLVAGDDVSLTDDAYVDLVARFAGPATTVQVFWIDQHPRHYFRSHGDGVHECSFRFTRMILHPHQVDILNEHPPLVWLCGPPGTGKTLVLAVRATDWWYRKATVHVFSTHDGSLAASHLIYHQLQQIAGSEEERIHLHEFNFRSLTEGKVESAVKSLLTAHKQEHGPLCVIVDEAYPGNEFVDFCTELHKRVPELYLWAASMYHSHRPPCLKEVPMTEPLRTPPVVTKEVQQSAYIQRHAKVRDYTEGSAPPPAYGPAKRFLYHKGKEHCNYVNPIECEECGVEVARILKKELHVDVPGPVITAPTSPTTPTPSCTATGTSGTPPAPTSIPAPLKYQDVFLLSAWAENDFRDDVKDAAGNVIKPASGVVRGLRSEGVPVKVLKYGDSPAVRDVAVMEGQDAVVAAYAGAVSGLERAVVVWVQTHRTGTETVDEDVGRLMAISRTTAQLVWVVWPWDKHEDDD
nr:hypothetical protein BaRGS_005768 [Batillaria attramentaria]